MPPDSKYPHITETDTEFTTSITLKNDDLYNNFDIKEKNPKNDVDSYRPSPTDLAVTPDGNLVVALKTKIYIYSSKTYEHLLTIVNRTAKHNYLLVLSDGKILVDDKKENINIYNITNIKEEKYELFQKIQLNGTLNCIKEFSDQSIILSISGETFQKIEKYILQKDSDKYKKDSQIIKKNIIFGGFIQLNKKQMVVSCKNEEDKSEYLSYYDLETRQSYAKTEGVPHCLWGFKLDDNYISFSNSKGIYLINLRNHQLVNKYQINYNGGDDMNSMFDICRLNTKMILINDKNGNIIQLKIDEEKIEKYSKTSKTYHQYKNNNLNICRIYTFNNGEIATLAYMDNYCEVKVW